MAVKITGFKPYSLYFHVMVPLECLGCKKCILQKNTSLCSLFFAVRELASELRRVLKRNGLL